MDSVRGSANPGSRRSTARSAFSTRSPEKDRARWPTSCARPGLARPTAHRLAVALERHALVVRDGDGRFRLGARLVGWGAAAGAALALVEPARAVLQRLSADTGESAQLLRARRRSAGVRRHARTPDRPARHRAARRGDAAHQGIGRAGAPGVGRRLATGSTSIPPCSPRCARAGWAATVGEREPGVASVSAPVRVGEQVVAALSVSGPAERLGPDPGAGSRRRVVSAAADLDRARGATRHHAVMSMKQRHLRC